MQQPGLINKFIIINSMKFNILFPPIVSINKNDKEQEVQAIYHAKEIGLDKVYKAWSHGLAAKCLPCRVEDLWCLITVLGSERFP